MTQEMKMRIALSRYSVISPLVNGTADPGQSHNQFFIEAAQKTYAGPYGTPMTVGASTVEKWYLAYKKRGFDALIPKDRSDMGDSRKLIPDMQDQILYFMKEFPDITAAEIERKLLSSGSISPGEISSSTISRFVRHKKEMKVSQERRICVVMSARTLTRYGMGIPVLVHICRRWTEKNAYISSR